MGALYKNKLKKNNNGISDLDALIKQKEKDLLGKNKGYTSSTKKSNSNSQISSILEEKLLSSQLPKSTLRANKKFLQEIQWGGGVYFEEIESSLKKKGIKIKTFEVSQTLKSYLKKKWEKKTPSISTLKEFCKIHLFIDHILKNQDKMPDKTIMAIHYYLNRTKKSSKNNLIKKILEDSQSIRQKKISNSETKIFTLLISLWENGEDQFIYFISIIEKEALFFNNFAPYPQINKKDIGIAYTILNASRKNSKKEIKKKYRDLIKLRHPDKFTSLKLPARADKIIHENFTKIQQAYDLLEKEIK